MRTVPDRHTVVNVTVSQRAPRIEPIDVVVAVIATTVLLIVMATQMDASAGERSFDALAGACTVVAGGALCLHRRAPLVLLGLATAAMVVYTLREYPGGPVYVTTLVGMFAVSADRGPSRAWLPAATATILLTGAAILRDYDAGDNGLIHVLFVSWAVAAVLLGGVARSRRLERAALEERARHLAETREEEARRRVVEERLRIARDLHDSVAHSLASIAVQAGVGAHVLDERPDDARAALLAIRQASAEALGDLRATLGMLRSDEVGAPRDPGPGLAQLDALVAGSRSAGLPVEVVLDGAPTVMPLAVDVAAYRIVQESLTNVLRHAGPARASVELRFQPPWLEITVVDDGVGPSPSRGSTGHGLAGMRERAAALGGDLDAGSNPGGGFRVHARLPLDPAPTVPLPSSVESPARR
jgi:signal transduction histidine kinase